ncbi:MAG TPA: nucleotidyltransferase domain-containing protein [Nitrospiraceae bacterium]|nr:nucleotidyltransferase domain-containing protein [Nitrospiraceae bacterium]
MAAEKTKSFVRALADRHMPQTILRVLVGSQAHGLAGPDSDADYRSVFAIPTEEMFRLGFKYQGTRMVKEEADETSWEIGLFLSLATEGHPLILETFLAPVITADKWGTELRALFPAVWTPQIAYEAFVGYAMNQRKKFLEKKDSRPAKYAVTYLRALYNLCELLQTGTFTIQIGETPIGATIARIKDGVFRTGEVIDLGEEWILEASRRVTNCRHLPDLDRVNEFLLRLRKAFLT